MRDLTVLFLLAPDGRQPRGFREDFIGLTEGLRSLGVRVLSNNDYWKLSPDQDEYLIRRTPGWSCAMADVVVVASEYVDKDPLPPDLFAPNRRHRTVFIDYADGLATPSWRPEYRQFDVIFRILMSRKAAYPPNIKPWPAVMLSSRLLHAVARAGTPPKDTVILSNFRNWHQLRAEAQSRLVPVLEQAGYQVDRRIDQPEDLTDPVERLENNQTSNYYYPNYYRRLARSIGLLCVGGTLRHTLDYIAAIRRYVRAPIFENDEVWCRIEAEADLLLDLQGAIGHAKRVQSLPAVHPQSNDQHNAIAALFNDANALFASSFANNWNGGAPILFQWDSPRFWEALAAGVAAIHVDHDYYGIDLPVLPVNYRDYIGVNFDDLSPFIEFLRRGPEAMLEIGARGRAWGLEHYSAEATARRFLAAAWPG